MTPRGLTDRKQRRRQRLLFWGLAAVVVTYGLFVGGQRPYHLLLLWLEERRVEERMAGLEERNTELEAERARLEADSLALESLARDKGMVRPGDLVYRILPVPPGVREAAAESMAVRAAREEAARAADSLRLETRRGPRPAAAAAPANDPRWVPMGADSGATANAVED